MLVLKLKNAKSDTTNMSPADCLGRRMIKKSFPLDPSVPLRVLESPLFVRMLRP